MPSKRTRIELLEHASTQLIKILDITELLKSMLDIACEGLDADRGTVFLVDHEKEEVWSKVFIGDEISEFRLPITSGITGYVARTGEMVNIEDAYEHPLFNNSFDKKTGYRTKSMLCVPIRNTEDKIIGVFQMLNKDTGKFLKEGEDFLYSLANYSSVALEMASLHMQLVEKERIEHELKLARRIQEGLLPKDNPQYEGYEIFGYNLSCEAVSGDYYDFLDLGNGRLLTALGDVSGKGIPASIIMAVVQSHLKALVQHEYTLPEFAMHLNKYLYENSTAEKYITFHLGILDTNTHRFESLNAGHNPPCLVRSDGTLKEFRKGGPLIGGLDGISYISERAKIEKGDLFFAFTDGLTEVFDKNDEEFGEERLYKLITENRDLQLPELFGRILNKLRKFSFTKLDHDDMTVVAFRKL